ncbi:TetR/AcrR family transcriptional regulator [Solirubrobacter sp. CPCC 204708]|uniref:TetR/AcrR family transcriptional regulator n=1 Tax=Solirubrobacter deserti TaxID=2282478 RepID=A0ABT4RIF1_9ACTN|nr:TetR/AcrR family transcriptional regulator [Solirubrobacter deserti]MBE2318873.1 TetR/AcrR family transcriptional regulator [Solirubrobacter deserti]MDA0138253.1 TetR/AcrR family transcriptional regulator [Solirubrobacter deserti]
MSKRGEARRAQVIDVALRLFAAHGFRGVSLATIAQEAGISEPGLIHHYPTKAELLLAVLDHYEAGNRELMATAWERSGGEYGGAWLALAAAHEADPTFIRFFTVLAAESVAPDHPAHDWFVERYERVRTGIAQMFAAAQQAGDVRLELDPDLCARQLVAMFDGIQLQYLLAGGALDLVAPLRELLRSFTGASSTA